MTRGWRWDGWLSSRYQPRPPKLQQIQFIDKLFDLAV
jgi:hypothetical protein